MNTIKIKWIQTNFDELPHLEDTYLYAFSRGNTLLYVGMTYYQIVDTEIKQSMYRIGINPKGLSLWLGFFDFRKSTFQRISRKLVLDTENLLIVTHQSNYNVKSTINYKGRNNFRVRTSGSRFFRPCVKCERNTVYRSC